MRILAQHVIELAARLGDDLRRRGWTIATAESCTGGGIALAVTSVAGSSDYMVGGIVAYSNRVKQAALGVTPATLAGAGAVSRECALEMARGVQASLDADIGISSTGIAGPGGGSDRKPVGLVYIAIVTPQREEVHELHLEGNRLDIMQAAVIAALESTLSAISEESAAKES